MSIKKKEVYELLKGKEVSLNKVKGVYVIEESVEINFKELYKLKLKLDNENLDEKVIDVTTNDVELSAEDSKKFIDKLADKTKEVLRDCELELKEQETHRLEEDLVKRLENRLKMESLKLNTEDKLKDDVGLSKIKDKDNYSNKTECFNHMYVDKDINEYEANLDLGDNKENELSLEDKLKQLLKDTNTTKNNVKNIPIDLGGVYDILQSLKKNKGNDKGDDGSSHLKQSQPTKIDLSPLFDVLIKGVTIKELNKQKDTKKGTEDLSSELMNELFKTVLKKQIIKGVGGNKALLVSTLFDMLNSSKKDELKPTKTDNKGVNSKEELVQLIKDLGVGLGGIEVNKDKLKKDAVRVDEQDGKIKLDKDSDADRDWYK